jgi:hypothetical protein
MAANGGAVAGAPAPATQKGGALVLDYGSQYTQLICRRIRELGVYSVMLPGDVTMARARASAALWRRGSARPRYCSRRSSAAARSRSAAAARAAVALAASAWRRENRSC